MIVRALRWDHSVDALLVCVSVQCKKFCDASSLKEEQNISFDQCVPNVITCDGGCSVIYHWMVRLLRNRKKHNPVGLREAEKTELHHTPIGWKIHENKILVKKKQSKNMVKSRPRGYYEWMKRTRHASFMRCVACSSHCSCGPANRLFGHFRLLNVL